MFTGEEDDFKPLTDEEMQMLDPNDMIDYDEDVAPALPASAEPSQPLSASPAMDAALSEISSGAPASRTRGYERRQASDVNPAAMLRAKIGEAQRQVEATRKAEADKAAAFGQPQGPRPEKRNRPLSGTSPTASGKKAKSDHPAADQNAMDITGDVPANRRPTSFEHLFRAGPMPCAVMIDANKVMGNPFPKSPMPGWDLKVKLDPGVLAQPSVGLNFKFGKDGSDSKRADHYNTFAVGWEPGVKIGGKWMMEEFGVEAATKPSVPQLLKFTYPPAIQALCKKPEDADKLFCMTFKSNVHKSSPMKEEWAQALKGDDWVAPSDNLHRMYSGGEPSYQVTVWFMNPYATSERLMDGCILPLTHAVEDHTPPFHQYLDENDEPMIDWGLKTIGIIGNGMYRRYPKVTDPAGKKVEDRSRNPTYYNLPKTVTWDSIKTFHVTYGVPLVRELQYNEGVHSKLALDHHRVFLQRMPEFTVEGKNLVPAPKMLDTYWAGVRMTRDPETGTKAAVPPVGTTVTIEIGDSGPAKKGREMFGEHRCYGKVDSYGGRAWLETTGTDFVCLMTMPRRFNKDVKSWPTKRYLVDEKLPLAMVTVKVDRTTANRDKRAFAKLCSEDYAPGLLDPIRLAFWSDPSKTGTVTDLTAGPAHRRSDANKDKYKQILQDLKQTRRSNQSQDKVLMAASSMRSNIAVVQGPPGAGKTRTLRDKVIALTKVGHKVVCVASSNVAVDTDANAVWSGLSPEDRKNIKCLRLETDGAEKAQRLAKIGYAAYTGAEGEADKMPEYLGPGEAQDNPAIRNALDKICMEFATRQEYATQMFEKYENLNEAYQAIQEYDPVKRSNVAAGMTLDYRIWEITERDRRMAEADYRDTRERMSPAEFDRQVATGQISIASFDNSRKYRECMANYQAKGGRITRVERTAFEDESDSMVERVLAETHILFTTASNCGGTLLEGSRSFVPTLIFCDESGQISVPSFCVPLTTFDQWEGLFLFGDVQQLEPTVLSGQFNEFIANARMSPLALLAMKGFPSYLLDEQYRMCPACSLFPRWQFYDNQGLKDSAAMKEDNEVRKAMREITLSMGIKGDKGQGSEYVVTNVPNGCSQVELNGTSLVNHANADVIIRMIDRFLNSGTIKASMIKILSYYQGQRRFIRSKINDMTWPKVVKDAIEISTVDAFQGREARIVIVDTVAAKDKYKDPTAKEESAAEDDEDRGGEDYIKVGTVTTHVRSPNRLNVALTRGKDATIVVCQAALLVAATRKNRGKQYNAVANMIGDAKGRDCWMDDRTEDSHPKSVDSRARMDEKSLNRERVRQWNRDLEFIAEGKLNWKDTKKTRAIPLEAPFNQYRTRGGHTTRPIGNPELTAKADAYDVEQERIRLAKEASLATAAAKAEEQRAFDLAIKESLGSSTHPPAAEAATEAADVSEQPSATDAKADTEDEDDAQSEVNRKWLSDSDAQDDDEDEDAGAGDHEDMVDVGKERDQFA